VTVPPGADPRIGANGNVVVARNTVVDTLALFPGPGAHGQDRAHLASASAGSSMSPTADSTVRVGELSGNVSALGFHGQMINAHASSIWPCRPSRTYRKMDDPQPSGVVK